jgi:hypothetical protein
MGIEEQFILLSIAWCIIIARVAIRWRIAGPANWQIAELFFMDVNLVPLEWDFPRLFPPLFWSKPRECDFIDLLSRKSRPIADANFRR